MTKEEELIYLFITLYILIFLGLCVLYVYSLVEKNTLDLLSSPCFVGLPMWSLVGQQDWKKAGLN